MPNQFHGRLHIFPSNAEYGSRNVCLLLKVHLNPGVGISGNWVVTQFFWRQDDDTVVDRKLKLGTFVSTPPWHKQDKSSRKEGGKSSLISPPSSSLSCQNPKCEIGGKNELSPSPHLLTLLSRICTRFQPLFPPQSIASRRSKSKHTCNN